MPINVYKRFSFMFYITVQNFLQDIQFVLQRSDMLSKLNITYFVDKLREEKRAKSVCARKSIFDIFEID